MKQFEKPEVKLVDCDLDNDTVVMIRDSFIPAFAVLESTLREKLKEAGDGLE